MDIRNNYINKYDLQKTLRFSLIPQGKTLENIEKFGVLNVDEKRAEKYKVVKKLIDSKHKAFIEKCLHNLSLGDELLIYYDLYRNKNKSDNEVDEMKRYEEILRKKIAKAFTSDSDYKRLFGKDLFDENLYNLAETDEEKEAIELFCNGFTTYFSNFNTNRENMYSSEEKSTAISFRLVNQNLPKFIDNIIAFEEIAKSSLTDRFEELKAEFSGLGVFEVKDLFSIDYFNFVLSQSGITLYNNFIGGYTTSDGVKIQGLNEYINLYNQEHKDKQNLPLMKPLFKQILSDREHVSFVADKFESDNELLKAIDFCYDEEMFLTINEIYDIFTNLKYFDLSKVYIKNGPAVTDLSNGVFESWSAISDKLNEVFDNEYNGKAKKDSEKYNDIRKKHFKNIPSYSLAYLSEIMSDNNKISEYYSDEISNRIKVLNENYESAKTLIKSEYPNDQHIANDEEACRIIKRLLDSTIELKNFIKPLLGSQKEAEKDNIFYGRFEPAYEMLDNITLLYNKVRNYLTQKPYSIEKIKLSFNNSVFLNGWDPEMNTKSGQIIQLNGKYYLAIVDKKFSKEQLEFLHTGECQANRLIIDFQKPDNKNTPRLFIRSKGTNYAPAVNQYNLPIENVIEIYDKGKFKTEYRKTNETEYKESLIKMINYFKEGFTKHNSYSHYNFQWKKTEEYDNIADFYKDTITSCYKVVKDKINFDNLMELVNDGKLYLFQIYNKDFSEYSKGTENLHTMYFKMLFDEKNLMNVVYKLNGGAEMFYRKASIKEKDIVVHHKNEPINNKNTQNEKKQSEFSYDIIKDRRFTVDKFQLHIPITLNFKSQGQNFINDDVRRDIKSSDDVCVIGIDRGERNLIYISVVSPDGKIIEQHSLNEIINTHNNNVYKTDYHKLLDYKEADRLEARKEWKTIESIKELKEGYLSQVVHKIVQLMIKYNAIVVMEDLNSGMKNSRIKVEKQVYQKFENMLTEKLKYCVDKQKANEDIEGGLLKAYQLVNKDFGGKQNGFIFYIPSWNTSKIDPVTGFTCLFNLKRKSIDESKAFINAFDSITYNSEKDYFEFKFDYHNFGGRAMSDYRRNWTVCTYGDRIETFRNADNNSMWDSRIVNITEEFKKLYDKYGIDYKNGNLKNDIVLQKEKSFFTEFLRLFKLTLQMRNSVLKSTKPEDDYMISPVCDEKGNFYDSRNFIGVKNADLPVDADANGAYNIARKGLWAISQIKNAETDQELKKARISITNKEWLEFAQK